MESLMLIECKVTLPLPTARDEMSTSVNVATMVYVFHLSCCFTDHVLLVL